jgi:hypothetical protein
MNSPETADPVQITYNFYKPITPAVDATQLF